MGLMTIPVIASWVISCGGVPDFATTIFGWATAGSPHSLPTASSQPSESPASVLGPRMLPRAPSRPALLLHAAVLELLAAPAGARVVPADLLLAFGLTGQSQARRGGPR